MGTASPRAWSAIRQKVRPTPSPSSARWGGSRGSGRPMSRRSEEHTSELQSLMRISYAVFCLKKKRKYLIRRKNIRTKQECRILDYRFTHIRLLQHTDTIAHLTSQNKKILLHH